MNFEKINLITQNFFCNSKVLKIDSIDSGLINKTYIIEQISNGKKSKFILQCLSDIFESHEIVITNHKLITDHIKKKIESNYLTFNDQRYEVPDLIRCDSNNLFIFPFDSRDLSKSISFDETKKRSSEVNVFVTKLTAFFK